MAGSSLGHLAATVSLNINPFKASNNVLKAEIKSTANALRAQEIALKGSANSLNNMRAVYATMQSQMNNYNAQLQRSKALMDDTTRSERSRLNAANQFNKTSAQVEILRTRMQALSREIVAQSSRWGQLAARANHFGNVATAVGSRVQGVGRGMSTYLTAPIAAGLAYSASKLVDFQDAMNRTKNVIRTSGESAAETQRSYNQMLRDSRKYSDMYGVSQIKIANGYQDLVKRGYTSKAAVGVMRNELKASIATGDDFNDVIKVASQTMESFGLSTNKAGQPLKSARLMQERSKDTLNKLAYAADATSTDFNSLGVGMSYVGATAHQAGFGLGETASAMGILSNNGLEADKAGTGLRKVIQSLITPTKGGAEALAKINLSTKDFIGKNGKLKSMSTIFATLNKHMKGLTGHEKNDIFHSLFGTTGQQAGAILTENAKRLRELTNEVNNAGKRDYIGDLAKRNLNTPKAQLAIFKESLTNAGMDAAKNVLPIITPLVQDLSKLAQGFGQLPEPMKKAITYTTLFVTGAGPLLLLIGKLSSGVGGLALKLGSFAGGMSRARAAISMGAGGLTVLKSAFSKNAFETAKFGKAATTASGAMTTLKGTVDTANGTISSSKTIVDSAGRALTTAGESAAVAGTSFGAAAIPIAAATAVIIAGVAAWELWGKKAAASDERTNRWGSDVGVAADHALSKMQSTSQGIQTALSDMDVAAHTSTKKMADDFDREFTQIERSAREHFKNVKKAEKGLSPEVSKAIDAEAEKEKSSFNGYVHDADVANQNVQKILSGRNRKVSELDQTQRTMLRNYQAEMLNDEMKTLQLSGSRRAKAMAVLNNDIKHMSQQQRSTRMGDITSETAEMEQQYKRQASLLKKRYKNNELSRAEYRAGLKSNQRALSDYSNKAAAEYIRLARANGESTSLIKKDLKSMGLSYKAGTAEIRRQTKAAMQDQKSLAVNTTKMSGKVKKAANMWNNLVFDPKTGKVRTNAQEEVNKAVNSSKGWNQIKLLKKEGKLSTNAQHMVAAALIANGQWDSMSWPDKQAWLHDKFHQTIVKALEDSGQWNNLTLEQKEAIVNAKGKQEMADLLMESVGWNNLTLQEKQAIVADKATLPLVDSLQKSGQWNGMTLKQQEAIINAKGKDQLVDALVKGGVWNSLSLKQQLALVRTQGTEQVIQGIDQMGRWNSLSPKQQQAIVSAKGGPDLQQLITDYGLWRGLPASAAKQIIAQDRASGNLKAANDAMQAWIKANPGAPKNALAIDNASGPLHNATGGVNVFAGSSTGAPKVASGVDNASGPFGNATNSIFGWNGTGANTKNIRANDQASKNAQIAISAIDAWNKAHPIIHKFITEVITKHKNKANGANYFEGGPVMVNDQKGPIFREMVQFPGEIPFIPYGRNVLLNAPRGTRIVKASDTLKQFPHLPQYANGNSDAVSVLNNIQPVQVGTKGTNNSQGTSAPDNKYMGEVLDRLGKMTDRLGTMLGLNAAQLSAIKASAFDKNDLYSKMGMDQVYYDAQRL
ncbi:phage tail tape measure protein [Limosilactobacillus antri]|uniref:phage tail tape measure protein n=1 Tax=Limosilactobacillus antri TaxID=227943 RepID=UPI001F58D6DB|nr:phage tail tape measure protein [Limosilactobacillus antri]